MCQTASTKCDTNIANDEQPPSASSCTDGFVHFSLCTHLAACIVFQLLTILGSRLFFYPLLLFITHSKLIITVNNPPKHFWVDRGENSFEVTSVLKVCMVDGHGRRPGTSF